MAGNQKSWLKTNYEKLALLIMLTILLTSTLLLVLRVNKAHQNIKAIDQEQVVGIKHAVEPLEVESWINRKNNLRDPFQVTPESNDLMVSEIRVACIQCGHPILFHAEVCHNCQQIQPDIKDFDQDGDGIPDEHELEYGLNHTDHDSHEDNDGDGFTNLEEYKWGSHPNDAATFPEPAAKLRWARIKSHPFKLRFQGTSELADGMRFLLNLRTLDKSYFARVGDVVEGYKVIGFNEATQKRPSSVVLEKDAEQLELFKNKVQIRYERSAILVFLIDAQRFKIRVGDSIELKGQTYNIVDIKPKVVRIRHASSQKISEVEKLVASELIQLREMISGTTESEPQNSTEDNAPPQRRKVIR